MPRADPFVPDSKTGLVRVWDIPAKEYRMVWPIDAREQVRGGTARFHKDEDADTQIKDAAPKRATEDQLRQFNRPELNAYARSVGLDGEGMANKGEVVLALLAHGFVIPDNA